MFGYLAQAATRAAFQRCILASAYGPLESRDFTLTHITGWPWAADIIRAIRVDSGVSEPAATSAVSSVPRASTQQPRKPSRVMLSAASYPLTVPGRTSTIDRPPAMFIHTLRTP